MTTQNWLLKWCELAAHALVGVMSLLTPGYFKLEADSTAGRSRDCCVAFRDVNS